MIRGAPNRPRDGAPAPGGRAWTTLGWIVRLALLVPGFGALIVGFVMIAGIRGGGGDLGGFASGLGGLALIAIGVVLLLIHAVARTVGMVFEDPPRLGKARDEG